MEVRDDKIWVSVVVPFCNAEHTIAECVHPLMLQTLQSGIEFIFVDDGSTDGSCRVLASVIGRHPERMGQVRIISNGGNKGVAYSRERGVSAARGEYVIHCDADDWVECDMYENMLDCALRHDADIVCCNYITEYGLDKSKVVAFKSADFPEINNAPLDTLHFALWNKLIRRRLIVDHGLHFFEGVDCWEDQGIVFRALIFSKMTVLLDSAFYHYRKAEGSQSLTALNDKVLREHLLFVERMEEWFATQPQELADACAGFRKNVKFIAKVKMLRGKNRDIARWKSTYPEANSGILSYSIISLHYRLCFYLADKLPLQFVKAVFAMMGIFGRKRGKNG